ncbi:TIGR03790 family protein [Roseateles sp. BYS180W]|uniref:TIGR03790 family protein n=1 Tax=Roseateles rivi TaxID=3299028 RepID=A0ABW7FW96_9BURK
MQLSLQLPAAGLKSQDLALIVAEGDPLSEAVAAEYQAQRGVPDSNIIRVKIATNKHEIGADAFAAIKARIDAQMPANVQASLITWSAPSRVKGARCAMGITSAMAWGYDANACMENDWCIDTRRSDYFATEVRRPFDELGWRPAMLLGARTIEEAKTLIARGVAADGSLPTGTAYLVATDDTERNTRYPDYAGLPSAWAGRLNVVQVNNMNGKASNQLSGRQDVLVHITGIPFVTALKENRYLPGAIGDNLTSYGGLLPSANGQTSVWEWLDAGLTATYGTVEEPCNFPGKFAHAPTLLDQYYRGASLIEAYWKSVKNPGQGLFVGEPLARPWPDQPKLEVVGYQYRLSARSLIPGRKYALEYAITDSWIELGAVQPSRSGQQSWTLPLAPAAATKLRWRGPCTQDPTQTCTLASSQ